MKHNLKDTTFIIPIRIESEDRMRNVITVCCFLLKNFDTKVIIKEVDNTSVFARDALPQITEYVGEGIDNLTHIFEQSDPNDHVFYRMRYLNEMLAMCDTEVIANYDCDVMMPIETYLKSQEVILNGEAEVIYPYGEGIWQKKVYATDGMVSDFLSNDCDFKILEQKIEMDAAHAGHVQFIKRSSYIEAGMENENFRGSAPEDKERIHRFVTLGYKVARVENFIYHLEHSRGPNSWPVSYHGNPHMMENQKLWQFLQGLDKGQLRRYYDSQKYLRKYK